MKLNKKVVGSAAVILSFVAILTIIAVTNSGNAADEAATTLAGKNLAVETVLANTSLENDGTAGATATLNYYQEAAAEEKFLVETVATDVVSTSENGIVEDETWQDELESDWSDKLMAKVDESLYVRAEADADAEVVGKLYTGDRALIVEEGDQWTKIKSGYVEGYVNNEFCVTGTEAMNYADEICDLVATVNIDGLRVRADRSEEADVVGKLSSGETVLVDKNADQVDGWVAIRYAKKCYFVSDEYVSVAYQTGKAITKEAEDAAKQAEAERIAAEEAAKKAEAEKKYAEYKKQQEAKKKAESSKKKSTTKKSTNKKTSSSSSKPATTQGSAVSASTDDATLLAALIYCEAGNCSYDGQLAVGAVVMNRVKSKKYPSSIKDVIYQKGQFSPASSGRLAKVIAKGPSATSIKAAKAAISGIDNTDGAIGFKYASSGKQGVVYGKVVFFK